MLLAHLGAIRAGGVSLPLNFKFTPSEMRYYAADSGSVLAVGGDAELPVLQALVEDQENSLRGVLHADEFLALAPQPTAPLPASTADDWALLLYSSGTTGQPKGVVHTHANLGAAVRSLADCWAFTPDDVLVNVLPFFHIHGLSFASHVNFLTGAHMLMGDQFHPVRTLDLIDRATVFMAIPPMYYQFLNRPEFREHAKQWSHVRLFTCGSAPIRPEVLPELERYFKESAHQSLRHDREPRDRQPAYRSPQRAGLGGTAAGRGRDDHGRGRLHDQGRARRGRGARERPGYLHPLPEQAGSHRRRRLPTRATLPPATSVL